MTLEWPIWNSPWELYFHGFVWVPLLQRLILLTGPGLAALYRHGRHLGWGWHRLLELPRGRAIALNMFMGLLVPVGVGLTIRLVVGPFGEDWSGTPIEVIGFLLAFLVIHTVLDVRRMWRVRLLICKIIETRIERYRSYYERARGMAKRVAEHASKYQQEEDPDGKQPITTRIAGGLVDRARPLLDRVMETPHSKVRRWSMKNILEGLAFHLSPVIILAILLSI